MSKKRSLGSSPIGYKSDDSSMGFIPDLGVSKSKTDKSGKQPPSKQASSEGEKNNSEKESTAEKKPKKKIVSYNLEVDLITEIKSVANNKDMYYSSLVSMVLKSWLAENR